MNHDFQDYQAQDPQAQEMFQETPPKKNAAYYRAMAREKLRPCYWYALLASFVASLLGGVSSGNVSVNFSGLDLDFNAASVPMQELAEAWKARDFSILLEQNPTLLFLLVVGIVASVFGIAFSLFVGAPMRLGYQKYQLNVMDGNGKDISVMFRYFKNGYGKAVGLHLVYSLLNILVSLPLLAVMLFGLLPASVEMALYAGGGAAENSAITAFVLWVILFFAVLAATVAVSIWITYRYAFCYTILAEYPETGIFGALRSSGALMKGKKWRLFCLEISFIGWLLLAACCTCGIGAIFLMPYMNAARVAFYHDATNRDAAKDVEFPSIDPDDYVAE